MKYVTTLAACLSFAAVSADEFPPAPAPLLRAVQANQDELQIRYSVRRFRTETRTMTIEESRTVLIYELTLNGPTLKPIVETFVKEVTFEVRVPFTEERAGAIPLTEVSGYTMKGQRLTDTQIRERLKKPTIVMVSPTPRSVVDPVYLSVMKADAILLVINREMEALHNADVDDVPEDIDVPAPPPENDDAPAPPSPDCA